MSISFGFLFDLCLTVYLSAALGYAGILLCCSIYWFCFFFACAMLYAIKWIIVTGSDSFQSGLMFYCRCFLFFFL